MLAFMVSIMTMSSAALGSGAVVVGGHNVDYVKWEDPKEKAFSLEVPKGWTVTGGLFRYASVDTRPGIVALSPDEKIRISIGDEEVPPFAVPNYMLEMGGFAEGSWYSPGYGVNMMVLRYMTGAEFAEWYVNGILSASGFADISFREIKDLPEATQAINQIYAQHGLPVTLNIGEVVFDCSLEGQQVKGYYFAGTQLGAETTWNVQYLYGCLAEASQEDLARSVFEHMITSFKVNPEWENMQNQIAGATSAIVTDTNNKISETIHQSYVNRQKSEDETSRKRSNANLGLTDVMDPETGETWKVTSGSNYYWRCGGNIVGTEVYDSPGIDCVPVKEW